MPPSLKCLEAPFCPWPQPWWSQTQSTRSFGSCWHRTDAQLVRKTCGSLFPLLPLSRHNLLIQFPLKNNGFNEGGNRIFRNFVKFCKIMTPQTGRRPPLPAQMNVFGTFHRLSVPTGHAPVSRLPFQISHWASDGQRPWVSVFHWVALLWFEEGLGERREEPG